VHDEPLAGRWFGIRVPGVTVSLPVSDLDGFEQRLDALLDRWNAEGRWGLIRGPLPGASQVRAIEHTGDGTLRRWLSGRGPGYVWADGWLTIAASTDTLQMLLAVAAATPTNSTGDTAVNGRPRALARGPPLASALRMTAAAYILYRTVTDPEGSRGERSAVLAALPSFDIVREFEELDAVLGGEDGQWQADFTARLQPGTHPPLDAAGEAGVP